MTQVNQLLLHDEITTEIIRVMKLMLLLWEVLKEHNIGKRQNMKSVKFLGFENVFQNTETE